jgi:hypothetical protein
MGGLEKGLSSEIFSALFLPCQGEGDCSVRGEIA